MSVILETPRLQLRELTLVDRQALCGILQDETTMTAYEGAFDDHAVDEWLARMLDRYRTDGIGLWAAIDRASGDLIGQCGLTRQTTPEGTVVEVGYLFNRAFWGRGLATEAARASVAYGFAHLGVDTVHAHVRDTNIASMNVAIRLGMTVRGRFVKHYRGVTMPHLDFAVDREAWSAPAPS